MVKIAIVIRHLLPSQKVDLIENKISIIIESSNLWQIFFFLFLCTIPRNLVHTQVGMCAIA